MTKAGRMGTGQRLGRRPLLGGLAGGLLATPALAQPRWPERPIEVVVAFTAGGGTDIMARAYARFLEARLGSPVVVVNRPGAGGEVGFASVARARPDGHTLLASTMPHMITIPIERSAQYRVDQFAPIALIATDPNAIIVRADSPIRDLPDLLERARRAPDALNYGSPGVGSDDHLQLVLLQEETGIRMTHVSFPGTAQIRTALLGRHIEVCGLNVGEVAAAPEGMRMLVHSGERRSRFAQDVPTYREYGLQVEMASERGIVAPAGVPPAILQRLREETAVIARDPEFIRHMEALYTEMRFIPGEQWAEEIRERQARYEALWRRTPWRERA
ncbi:MAG: tripartite tricarboxylate transporter substrate binding protein [Rhodovarius sp.]|nr:tripartite tricarboxylate transporter substrate binding protein [Rhodovarius sp.]MDW8313870.1 tripartite tricarboxylate transporter substrate binding protein [Rhodovarius sp.]